MSGWNRLAPLGCDGVKEAAGILKGLIGSAAVAIFWFFITYFTYYNRLFEQVAGKLVLRHDAHLIPFRRVVGNSFVGFARVAVALVCLGIYHRALHNQGSRSMDLLRRLPDRWEGFRRCWAMPLLGLAAAVLLVLALLGGFWLFYDWKTPAMCRW